ncbi:Carboxylic ester hydrolase [Mycena sanguinolenta]|uniref:Carboxylic ester hydrolase n=1 Tax=Mycena sanguinolenta TaxID=230812 RepID=A0A8H6X521_9AGAR|nr:Carboxylic ester hydrolase [Mycena sanguinolenta]
MLRNWDLLVSSSFPSDLPSGAFAEFLFNNPSDPPQESEDCLFLNVWAPASAEKKAVLVWIYGGSLAFGTASLPLYDGASLASNQDIVVVTFNYRTNVFGFPRSPELALSANNLGFLDQELAFKWVQDNIAQFNGDPLKVTIMGQSAGAESVGTALTRHTPSDAPFRSGILLSGAQTSTSPVPSFEAFNTFAVAMGCPQDPGPSRLSCLKQVPAATIRNFTNSQLSPTFGPLVDNTTFFADPLERIRTGLTARVPFMIGNLQDDGSFFALGQPDLADWLNITFPGVPLTPALVRSFPAQLWSSAAVSAGISNVYRYEYGAVFADLQVFPGAGAWHSSELFGIFGNFNTTTATASEVELFKTMQATIGNYIKDPTVSPAQNWPTYVPGNVTATLAAMAYSGNVRPDNFIQLETGDSIDGPCNALWNEFLDVRV